MKLLEEFKPMNRFQALRKLAMLWWEYENITVTHWNGDKPAGWSNQTVLKMKEVEERP